MSSPSGPASPGDLIAGRYRVDSWLGQGNMAAVYRAIHLGTGQTCALKLVHPQLVERSEIRDLFVQEARVGARIGKNPHIVDVFDAGIDPQRGVPFLAMELLEGDTLDRYIKQRGPVSPGLARILFLQLADALGQAHAAGVVHRDLKPGNLFLTYDRKKAPLLKVVDFGIAKVIEEGVQGTATQVGSPAYAAPEQLGAAMRPIAAKMGVFISHAITPQTDIWALGVIAYELLLGAPPGHLWTGSERGTIADIMMGVGINPTPTVASRAGYKAHLFPRGFDEWLDRCLRKNATERWSSVDDAVRELADLLDTGYDDVQTQQIQPNVLLGITKQNPMRTTMPLDPRRVAAPQAAAQTAVLPPGLYPAATAAPPPPLGAPGASTMQPPIPSIPQSAATTYGLAGTHPPTIDPKPRRMGLVLGVVAMLGAIALAVLVLLPKSGGLATVRPNVEQVEERSIVVPLDAPDAPRPPETVESPPPSAEPLQPLAVDSPPVPPTSESSRLPGPMPTPPPVTSTASAPAQGNGTLNINSIPVSRVVVDGKPVGMTPRVGLSVPPGSHTVLFFHSELGKMTVTVTVKAGETKTAAVRFTR